MMMHKIVDDKDVDKILKILRPNREKCMYLYCNIENYRIGNQNFNIYIDDFENIVIGVYYADSVHIYSSIGINDEILDFIRAVKPRTIFSSDQLSLNNYEQELTGVYKLGVPSNSLF